MTVLRGTELWNIAAGLGAGVAKVVAGVDDGVVGGAGELVAGRAVVHRFLLQLQLLSILASGTAAARVVVVIQQR